MKIGDFGTGDNILLLKLLSGVLWTKLTPVQGWDSTAGHKMRTISISDQGIGFEPNSTMAILHYPVEPFAKWSFDQDETLFENSAEARFQPTSAWNRSMKDQRLNITGKWIPIILIPQEHPMR